MLLGPALPVWVQFNTLVWVVSQVCTAYLILT